MADKGIGATRLTLTVPNDCPRLSVVCPVSLSDDSGGAMPTAAALGAGPGCFRAGNCHGFPVGGPGGHPFHIGQIDGWRGEISLWMTVALGRCQNWPLPILIDIECSSKMRLKKMAGSFKGSTSEASQYIPGINRKRTRCAYSR